jgi:two-component system chemotaxis response regulator CheY
MRALIVEDEHSSRKFLCAALSGYGECDAVEDGVQAVQAFTRALDEKRPYDLVLMDIMMPNKDGQEALREIRQIEAARGIRPAREVTVIMTTALSDPRNVVQAFYEGGATEYLAKPIDVESLRQMLKNLGFAPLKPGQP